MNKLDILVQYLANDKLMIKHIKIWILLKFILKKLDIPPLFCYTIIKE